MFFLVQSLFSDTHKKISFLVYCYIRNVDLSADMEEYNEKAVYNSAYLNDDIIEQYERGFLEGQLLTHQDRELSNDMVAAILKVTHRPELLDINNL